MNEDELLRELEVTSLLDSQAIIAKAEKPLALALPAPAPQPAPMSAGTLLAWGLLGLLLGVRSGSSEAG